MPTPIHLACASDSSRFAINGVLYERKPGHRPIVVGTNGKALAIVPVGDESPRDSAPVTAIIPTRIVQQALRGKKPKDPLAPRLTVDTGAGNASAPFGSGTLSFGLIGGTFPPFMDVLPHGQDDENYTAVTLDAGLLVDLALAIGAGDHGEGCKVTILAPKNASKPLLVMSARGGDSDGAVGVLMPAAPGSLNPLEQWRKRLTGLGVKIAPAAVPAATQPDGDTHTKGGAA